MMSERETRPAAAEILARARALLPASRAERPLLILQAGVALGVRSLAHGGGSDRLRPRLDRLLRRLPVPVSLLCDLAGPRIVRSFADCSFRLTIIDDSSRALRAARHTAGPEAADAVRADLGVNSPTALQPLRGAYDIVIALADLGRHADERRRATIAQNLAQLVRPDGLVVERSGLLAAAPDMSLADFPAIYRRLA